MVRIGSNTRFGAKRNNKRNTTSTPTPTTKPTINQPQIPTLPHLTKKNPSSSSSIPTPTPSSWGIAPASQLFETESITVDDLTVSNAGSANIAPKKAPVNHIKTLGSSWAKPYERKVFVTETRTSGPKTHVKPARKQNVTVDEDGFQLVEKVWDC